MDYILGVLDRLRELTKEKIGKITSHEVAAVISSSTGIPIGKIKSGEKEKLLNMEDILRRRVVGQGNALKVFDRCHCRITKWNEQTGTTDWLILPAGTYRNR